jgi:hypothetical protein
VKISSHICGLLSHAMECWNAVHVGQRCRYGEDLLLISKEAVLEALRRSHEAFPEYNGV